MWKLKVITAKIILIKQIIFLHSSYQERPKREGYLSGEALDFLLNDHRFKSRGISRVARKLVQTLMVIKNKNNNKKDRTFEKSWSVLVHTIEICNVEIADTTHIPI